MSWSVEGNRFYDSVSETHFGPVWTKWNDAYRFAQWLKEKGHQEYGDPRGVGDNAALNELLVTWAIDEDGMTPTREQLERLLEENMASMLEAVREIVRGP